ncbi:hypothetical protein FRC17_009680 [Serendipita sp. 399]|nr:hypothetical protein FRC17_009680 [Serendipita sp. 399]
MRTSNYSLNEKQDNIFGEYRIESNSSNNTIALELSITPLVQALRSASSKGNDHREAAEVTLKLAKRGKEAALCMDIKTQTRDGKQLNVTHDIHVVVKRPSDVDDMSQPRCPPIQVHPNRPSPPEGYLTIFNKNGQAHIELPPAEQCRPVVEHLQRIGDIIWFGVTRDGRFRLAVNTVAGDIETMWTNLRNIAVVREKGEAEDGEEQDEDGEEGDDSSWHLVPLGAKILHKWLSSQVLQNQVIVGKSENPSAFAKSTY